MRQSTLFSSVRVRPFDRVPNQRGHADVACRCLFPQSLVLPLAESDITRLAP